jgi:uncharacterized tellurite resistance protein B-like protein
MLAPMFERLINSLGQPANTQTGDAAHDPELQLAAAQVLFAMLPVDYHVKQLECIALMRALERLFGQKLVSRAAAGHAREPGILASAMLLKRGTSLAYRQQVINEARVIALSDGTIHSNETDLINRMEALLGLKGESLQRSA